MNYMNTNEEIRSTTNWNENTKVYRIFENQYVTKQDAEFIQENHGNPSNLITEMNYNPQWPLFTIEGGEQIEIDVERNTFTKLHVIQADIIFKALYYTAKNEGVEIPMELTEVFEVLAEYNPADTHVPHTVEVMDYLSELIKNSPEYSEYFTNDDDATCDE